MRHDRRGRAAELERATPAGETIATASWGLALNGGMIEPGTVTTAPPGQNVNTGSLGGGADINLGGYSVHGGNSSVVTSAPLGQTGLFGSGNFILSATGSSNVLDIYATGTGLSLPAARDLVSLSQ
jgi:hypothetical protein